MSRVKIDTIPWNYGDMAVAYRDGKLVKIGKDKESLRSQLENGLLDDFKDEIMYTESPMIHDEILECILVDGSIIVQTDNNTFYEVLCCSGGSCIDHTDFIGKKVSSIVSCRNKLCSVC